jgi:hypothetical protein
MGVHDVQLIRDVQIVKYDSSSFLGFNKIKGMSELQVVANNLKCTTITLVYHHHHVSLVGLNECRT